MTRTVASVTADAVEAATGRDWDGWLSYLDDAVGANAPRHEVVAAVRNAGVTNGWWQQQVATGYERERRGQKSSEADDCVPIGVQRTVPVAPNTLWTYLVSDGVGTWLGETDDLEPRPRTSYETADGTSGTVQRVVEGETLRLTWHPDRLPDPATLQLTLAAPPNSDAETALRVHLADLPDATPRAELRRHWAAVLDRLQADLASDR